MEEERFLYMYPNYTTNLNNMRLNNEWCDLTIKVNEREFRAHKVILGANLKYFYNILSSDSYRKSKQDVISMEGLEAAYLEAFITYAYTGEILLTDRNAEGLLEIANHLGEDGIKDACIELLKSQQMKREVGTPEQILTLLGIDEDSKTLNFQFCNLTQKEWSPLEEIADNHRYSISACAVFNDSLYYITKSDQNYYNLNRFNPNTKQVTTLHSLSSIPSSSAVCTCDQFLYLCGGAADFFNATDQVLKYELRKISLTNSRLESLTRMETQRSCAAAIFYRGHLHVLGGTTSNSVEKYDPTTKKWTTLASMCERRHNFAVAILNGKLYACGGELRNNSVEVYDPLKKRWQFVASMKKYRYGFPVVVHEGKLFAIGGDFGYKEKTVEVYDPNTDRWQMDDELSSGLQIDHPKGGLIPSSYIANAN